jgi:energy-coupling factor transporter ATP-binding protein EcfA2
MSKPITKISLAGFRGATEAFELDFNPQKDLTMLFGENGAGKSTILDAIDVVCNGTIGCLDGVSVGQQPGKYLCTLGGQPASLSITVHSGGESWTGRMQRNAVAVAGSPARPRVRILRRNKILDLVQAQPSDRYKALQHFINIAVVELSEASLQQKLNDTDRGISELVRIKSQLTTLLDNLWVAENRPGPGHSAMEWAQNKVNTGITNLNTRLERLKQVVAAVGNVVDAAANYRTRTGQKQGFDDQMSQVNAEIAEAPSVNAASAVKLLDSLDKAKTYIEAEEGLDKCPTCRRPIGRQELLQTVTQEFSQLSQLKALTDRRRGIQEQLNVASSHVGEALETLVSALQEGQQVTAAGDIPEVVALNIVWPSWNAQQRDIAAILAISDLLATVKDELTGQRDIAQRDVSQFNSIKEWWRGITDADHNMVELERLRQGLQQAYGIVHEKRVSFTQGILDGIRQEANRLFQEIHPGEDIGLEQLKMEEERRGSVSQSGSFHGHTDVPPQAVFSESHLDTLGFCVWLALAKRESPEKTVLLIDDIFSSVDATHLSRIIDLLNTEAPNFLQVIVATHYRLWWDRCQNAQDIQRIHLGEWSIDNGIAAQNMPLVTQQLKQLVGQAVLDRQAVASKAGILLESALDDLAMQYECSLPRNKLNLYTLGALLNGCGRLFSKHNLTVQINANWNVDGQPENWQASAVKAAFDRVNALQFIRNQVGCHFNPPGMEIPDGDVREFARATIDLVEAITCPNCGVQASKVSTDGTHLRCTCGKKPIRMTPVALS